MIRSALRSCHTFARAARRGTTSHTSLLPLHAPEQSAPFEPSFADGTMFYIGGHESSPRAYAWAEELPKLI